jgi:hypothetical protein
MKKMQEKRKEIQVYNANHKLHLKLSHRDGKYQAPPAKKQNEKNRGFGENVSQLSLCVNKLHLYLFLLNMVSQKVVSHFDVFGSPVETGLCARHMTLELSHMRGTLL